ncbi:MAG: ASCH domain-containing protein [Cyanobacteriota bacterium]
MKVLILDREHKVLLENLTFFEYEKNDIEFIKNDLNRFINDSTLTIYDNDKYIFIISSDLLSEKIKEKNISFKNICDFNNEILDFYYDKVLKGYKIEENNFDTWCFGGSDPDYLLDLVLSGKKYGTASLEKIYFYYDIELPKENQVSIITNSKGLPKAIIKSTKVEKIPFNLVDENHAKSEGEGDLSLKYWREVHWNFFSSECKKIGIEMNEEMLIVCEKFQLIKKII